MNRRGFLGSILALAAAPAIVRADSLMRIVPVQTTVWVPVASCREDLADVLGIPGARLVPASMTGDCAKYYLVAERGAALFRKVVVVSGPSYSGDRSIELAYAINKAGKEMRRDMERAH